MFILLTCLYIAVNFSLEENSPALMSDLHCTEIVTTLLFQLSADNKLKMSQARDGNLELELIDVKPVDTGKYSCTVTTATGDAITTTGNLTVTG